MVTVYTLFKFLHIVGAIGWLGGLLAFSIISTRSAREKDPAVLAAMEQLMRANGMFVIGPASGLTLIAGMVMLAVSNLGAPLWVIWGLAAIVVSLTLGIALIGPTNRKLHAAITAASPDEACLYALRQRLVVFNSLNLLVLLSAVWAMVTKPSL